jgi:hypothetical protein
MTFGMADKIANKMDALTGRTVPQGSEQAQSEAIAAEHPISNLVGEGAGMVAQGAGIGAGLKALSKTAFPVVADTAKWLIPGKDTGLPGLVGKGAAVGALAGTAGAAGNNMLGGDESLAAGAAEGALGGMGGALLGKAAGAVFARVASSDIGSAGMRAWRILADKLGEDPVELQQAAGRYTLATGQQPSLAQVVGMSSQGAVKDMAADYQRIGNQFVQARDANAALVQQELPRAISAATDQPYTAAEMTARSSRQMDQVMEPMRNSPVPVTGNDYTTLMDPTVRDAARNNRGLRQALNEYENAVTYEDPNTGRVLVNPDATHNGLTVGHIDTLRQNIRASPTAPCQAIRQGFIGEMGAGAAEEPNMTVGGASIRDIGSPAPWSAIRW